MSIIPSVFRSDGWVKSALGPAIPGAQIYVCFQPANVVAPIDPKTGKAVVGFIPNPLAPIFSDSAGLVPITAPAITDGFGHYAFYIAPGTYTLVVALGGVIQQVYPDQSIALGGSSTSVVTSVGLTMPAEFSVSGSPVTDAGVLAVTKAQQAANTVYAGPSSGPNAQPTFRVITPNDLPSVASGTNVIPGNAFIGNHQQATRNQTYFTHIPGASVMTPSPSGCKIGFSICINGIGQNGPYSIGQCKLLRTSRDSYTIIDSFNVLFSGASTFGPFTIPAGRDGTNPYQFFSDTVACPIDNEHDYWIATYHADVAGNTTCDVGNCTNSLIPTFKFGTVGNQIPAGTPGTAVVTNSTNYSTGRTGILIFAITAP